MFLFAKESQTLLLMQIFLTLITLIKNEINSPNTISLITPMQVSKEIENINKNGEIPYRIGKFGDIPFGKNCFINGIYRTAI